MFPTPQPTAGDLDSQTMFDPQYAQGFTDTRLDHYVDYMSISRRSSVDVCGAGELDPSIALNYLYQPTPYDYVETQAQEHLHAPVPVSIPYRSTHITNSSPQHSSPCVEQGSEGTNNHHTYHQTLSQSTGSTSNTNVHDYYTNAPQSLFPTPSELLTDLSAASAPISTVLPPSLAHPTQRAHSQSSEHSIEAPTSVAPAANKAESQRKARQRAIAEEIGFIPTDP